MIAQKGQCCEKCKHCDGFACLKLNVWLDGKIKPLGQSKKLPKKGINYIPVLVYGKKYCRYFDKKAIVKKT